MSCGQFHPLQLELDLTTFSSFADAYEARWTVVRMHSEGWIKNPAMIHPVWLEKRERIAALAMLTVVALLVYGLIQRQVRQYLQEQEETIPGNKGETDKPTATVVFESLATLSRVELSLDGVRVDQFHGWQAHHERVFRSLGLPPLIDDDPTTQKNNPAMPKGP